LIVFFISTTFSTLSIFSIEDEFAQFIIIYKAIYQDILKKIRKKHRAFNEVTILVWKFLNFIAWILIIIKNHHKITKKREYNQKYKKDNDIKNLIKI